MKKCIRIHKKADFNKIVSEKYKGQSYMWNYFQDETCFIPEENYFISLDKAKKLGYEIF